MQRMGGGEVLFWPRAGHNTAEAAVTCGDDCLLDLSVPHPHHDLLHEWLLYEWEADWHKPLSLLNVLHWARPAAPDQVLAA